MALALSSPKHWGRVRVPSGPQKIPAHLVGIFCLWHTMFTSFKVKLIKIYYKGHTEQPVVRLKQHNDGEIEYTSRNMINSRPINLFCALNILIF